MLKCVSCYLLCSVWLIVSFVGSLWSAVWLIVYFILFCSLWLIVNMISICCAFYSLFHDVALWSLGYVSSSLAVSHDKITFYDALNFICKIDTQEIQKSLPDFTQHSATAQSLFMYDIWIINMHSTPHYSSLYVVIILYPSLVSLCDQNFFTCDFLLSLPSAAPDAHMKHHAHNHVTTTDLNTGFLFLKISVLQVMSFLNYLTARMKTSGWRKKMNMKQKSERCASSVTGSVCKPELEHHCEQWEWNDVSCAFYLCVVFTRLVSDLYLKSLYNPVKRYLQSRRPSLKWSWSSVSFGVL